MINVSILIDCLLSKTNSLLFNRTLKKCGINFMINGVVIEKTESMKYLVVIL